MVENPLAFDSLATRASCRTQRGRADEYVDSSGAAWDDFSCRIIQRSVRGQSQSSANVYSPITSQTPQKFLGISPNLLKSLARNPCFRRERATFNYLTVLAAARCRIFATGTATMMINRSGIPRGITQCHSGGIALQNQNWSQ
jgi:hypothetical protein